MGKLFLLQEGKRFVLQHRQEGREGNAVKFAAVAALPKPAAFLGAQVQVPGKLGIIGAVMDNHGPFFLRRLAHERQGQLPAPDGRYIAQPGHIEVFPRIVVDIVGIEMQLGAVHEVNACGKDGRFLFQKGFVQFRRHGRLDAHLGNVPLCQRHVGNHPVGAVGSAQVEAELVQPGLPQGTEIFLRGQGTIGIHVLMNARLVEGANHPVIFFNLHERLQIHVGNPRGLFMDGKQQGQVPLIILGTADFPQSLPNGLNGIQLAIVVAELALGIAAVGFANGAQARAHQAGEASLGEPLLLPHI